MSTLTLSDAGLEVLDAIVRAREAWVPRDPIERARPGVLASLEAEGLIELWHRPDYAAVTLTPLAAELLHVQILEYWRYESQDLGQEQHPPCHHTERVAEEIPAWRPEEVDQDGVIAGPPIVLPRRAKEVPLPCPERVPDRAVPTQALDHYSGEPLRLLGVAVASGRRRGWGDAVRVRRG